MKNNSLLLLLVAIVLSLNSCVKDRITLDENVSIEGLDPSFAAPLLHVTLNMGDLEQSIDDDDFIYNEENEYFALIYPKELFTLRANDFLDFPSISDDFEFTAGGAEALTMNALATGSTAIFTVQDDLIVLTNSGEELESVVIKTGFLEIDLESEIPHDIDVQLTIPGLTQSGVVFSESVFLDHTGSTPFSASGSFDISGYTLDLSDGGNTSNFLEVEAQLEVTSTGNNTIVGSDVSIGYSFEQIDYAVVYGNLGQETQVLAVDTQEIKLFEDPNNGILHFEEPSIALNFFNSSGIPFFLEFSSLVAPQNQVAVALTGPDLENLPVIEGATFLGEDMVTTHTITNQGTSPSLSDMFDEGPFKIIYYSEITKNPGGETENFVMDTSRLTLRADVILPFYGYADNFTIADTLDLDLEEELGLIDPNPDEVLTYEDIERVTLRIAVDNGLPVQIGLQLLLLDSLNNTVDSVFTNQDYENIFESGVIDFSLPISDPDYGKVIQNTKRTTFIVITQEDVQFWLDNEVKKIIVRAIGNTEMSGSQELVKIYPEYDLDVKVSAKVDTQIDTTE
jgi:hypothetical protein